MTCVDGELSKDYLVKDRRAPSCQRQVSMDKQMYIVKPCWLGLTKTSLCWKTAALFRRKINFLWRFGGRRADNVQVTIDICRSGLWFGTSCKQIDSDRLFAKSIGSGAPVPLEVKRLGFVQEGIAFVDSGGSTSHCALSILFSTHEAWAGERCKYVQTISFAFGFRGGFSLVPAAQECTGSRCCHWHV